MEKNLKYDDLSPAQQKEYTEGYSRVMWDIEGAQRQYSIIDILIDGVVAISAVQLVDGTIKGIRGPPKDKNDDDKKGGPPSGGENKYKGIFGNDKSKKESTTSEPAKEKLTVDNDIFR